MFGLIKFWSDSVYILISTLLEFFTNLAFTLYIELIFISSIGREDLDFSISWKNSVNSPLPGLISKDKFAVPGMQTSLQTR